MGEPKTTIRRFYVTIIVKVKKSIVRNEPLLTFGIESIVEAEVEVEVDADQTTVSVEVTVTIAVAEASLEMTTQETVEAEVIVIGNSTQT